MRNLLPSPARALRAALFASLFGLQAVVTTNGQVPLPRGSNSKTVPSQPSPADHHDQPARPPAPQQQVDHTFTAPVQPAETILIPGPLRSFLRMAAISQKAASSEVLPLLAQNVYQHGYRSNVQTEFLLLIERYVSQARELQALAGSSQVIRVEDCAQAARLLPILGYRFHKACGDPEASLETANPERAFLTSDSGFPLTDLEEALQKRVPFTYPFAPSRVPILFRQGDWVSLSGGQKLHFGDCLDILLNDAAISRLYWGLSKTDAETSTFLQHGLGLRALLSVAPVLDFYGDQISIRGGRVLVPGGRSAEAAWKSLAGASPESPASFTVHLLSKDNGWLAAYYDALARVGAEEQAHLAQPARLQRNYEAFRNGDTKDPAAAHSFRQASDLLLLDTRLSWEPNGDPHLPGSFDVWKQVLQDKNTPKPFREWNRRARTFDRPDQIVEAMTAFSRTEADAGPLQLYLTLSELDRRRPADRQVSAATVAFLAPRFAVFSHWYPIFSEFPQLTDESIVSFINLAEAVQQTHVPALRANALGAFQANIGIWQILARQHEIPEANLNASWLKTIEPFARVSSPAQLFDAARASLTEMLHASSAGGSDAPGDMLDRLAGPLQAGEEGQRVHDRLVARMRTVLEDQQLVSLNTLFAISDGLARLSQSGAKGGDDLLSLSAELRAFELPRPIFTNSEKVSWAPAVYTSHHSELQVQTDLSKVIKTPGSRAQLEAARGQLVPFLRDTLVGLNYAYYEPPGAQILHINPLFVRAHDFLGVSVIGSDQIWQVPTLLGAGIAAGGGAFLMGSLADLPRSLAQAEEEFIVPKSIQALIWEELVPDLLTEATLPRWWSVTANELHAVALTQRSGEEILRASAANPEIRQRAIAILAGRLSPRRLEELQLSLQGQHDLAALIPRLLPADTFYLAQQYRNLYPDQAEASSSAARALATLAHGSPADVDQERLSHDFGSPHPTLAHTNARELLNLQPFPLSGGYTNRLFGESLESTNLYWARLADESGYSPAMLHLLVPELTRDMIGNIFASNIEDWTAVLTAMQETGENLKNGRIAAFPRTTPSPTPAATVARLPEQEPR